MLASLTLATIIAVPLQGADGAPIAKVPEGCSIVGGTLRVARDGAKVAFVVEKGGKMRSVVGGKLGDPYDVVLAPEIDASGAHVAFRAFMLDRRGDPNKMTLEVDGKDVANEVWIGPVAFSPVDGAPAYWVALGRSTNADGSYSHMPVVLCFGKAKSKKWQATDEATAPRFARDGKLVYGVATRDTQSTLVSLDAKSKEARFGLGTPIEFALSPDGLEIAYVAMTLASTKLSDSEFFVARIGTDGNGENAAAMLENPEWSSGSPVYSAEGRHIACKIMKEGKLGVALDGKVLAEPRFAFVSELAPTPDGTDVAFAASKDCKVLDKGGTQVLFGARTKGGTWIVVRGKDESSAYADVRELSWSRDGKTLAYAARTGKTWRAYAGTKSSDEWDDVTGVVWSADGKSVGFGCRKGAEIYWRTLAIE